MKKIFAILISLLFVASVFGVTSLVAGNGYTLTANPTNVAVGELITITYNTSSSGDLSVEQVGSLVKGDAYKVSGPTVSGSTTTWVYRARQTGTIKFEHDEHYTGSITITPKPHPMFFFMKILGLGKTD